MKKRCYNTNENQYKNYGGRGIYVCDRWKDSFENFYEDMKDGYAPGLQLDRIDNDGPYSPENCHWVTVEQNQRNKRTSRFITTAAGKKTLSEQAEISGINYGTLRDRLEAGMPEELSIIPNPDHKRLDIHTLKTFYDGKEAIWMDEKTEKNISDVFETAKAQAWGIHEWGFGPSEVKVGNDNPSEE